MSWMDYLLFKWMPRAHCSNGALDVVVPYVIANMVIFVCYLGIPFYIRKLKIQRADLLEPLGQVPNLFAAFIVSCGVGHYISTWVVWSGTYRFEAWYDVSTALISFLTLAYLPKLAIFLSKLPSHAQLNEALNKAKFESEQRIRIIQALKNEIKIRDNQENQDLYKQLAANYARLKTILEEWQ